MCSGLPLGDTHLCDIYCHCDSGWGSSLTHSSELSCHSGMILWFQFTAILSHSLSQQSGRGFLRPVYDLGVKWRRWGRRREERLSYRTVTYSHLRARLLSGDKGTRGTTLRTRESVTRPRSQTGSGKVSLELMLNSQGMFFSRDG